MTSFVRLHFLKIFTVLLIGSNAWSATSTKQRKVLFDVTGLLGYGSAKTSTDTAPPTIGSFTLGVALGVNIKRFSLGAAYDYRILTQYSKAEGDAGNRRGTFVSPMSIFVRLNFEKIKFGFVLINSGTYELMNKTFDGKTVSYSKPSGFRFQVNFKEYKKISPGLFYESVDFSEKSVGGINSPLTEKLNYSNYGFGVRYGF